MYKLISWSSGMAFLIIGAMWGIAPDWDIKVSILMGGFTFLTAEKSMLVVLNRDWKGIPMALFNTWWAVDGVYTLYWFMVDRSILLEARGAQWPLSLAMYAACGVTWIILAPERYLYTPVSTDLEKRG